MTRRGLQGQNGFTIIELLIVLVVMAILLILAVTNLNGTQAQGRDKQREVNAQTIASNLEQYYNNGTGSGGSVGTYPYEGLFTSAGSGSENQVLPNLDPKALIDPTTNTDTFTMGNGSALGSGLSPTPSSSNHDVVYQPLQSAGVACTTSTQICRSFNLYYYQETTNSVVTITSRNQ